MSRQTKPQRLEIVPDEIRPAPDQADATEIRGLYQASQDGIRAFVLMGFRLIDVKARLPHGSYMRWVENNLGDLSHRHLHTSRRIAEGIALRLGWSNWNHGSNLDELPPEVCELIDGKGYRAILIDLNDPLSGPAAASEEECRKHCEARWKKNPEERDEWEPRVLSGEITYHRALTGMVGGEATGGQPKREANPFAAILSGIGKMGKHVEKFADLPPPAQAAVVEKVGLLAEALPDACRREMIRVWTMSGTL